MTVCSTSDLADGKFGDNLCLGHDKTNYVSLIFVFWWIFELLAENGYNGSIPVVIEIA
jgi:hypothetical protein